MATRRKKAGNIKFELARSAIGGITIVVFCLFLWTFIFGVWAGQKLLVPQKRCREATEGASISAGRIQIVPAPSPQEESSSSFLHIRADKKASKKETAGKKGL